MPKTSKSINLSQYADALNAAAAFKSDFNSRAQVVKKIEIVQKQNIYGFENEMKSFMRIEIFLPRHLKMIKEMLEGGFEFPGVCTQIFDTFESNIDLKNNCCGSALSWTVLNNITKDRSSLRMCNKFELENLVILYLWSIST